MRLLSGNVNHVKGIREPLNDPAVSIAGREPRMGPRVHLYTALQSGSEYAEDRILLSIIYGPRPHRHTVHGLVPFRLLPFRLLPFRLLITAQCHFASRFNQPRLSQPREEHAHLSTKDTSILSTEEEEMAAFFFFWRCAKSRQCKGAVTTKENEIIPSRSDEHNHPKMKQRL